ncbi:monosaccharide ABC transporter ATP-binding protein (CUT2 family) [Haloactinopolyspora alba]|uniref:Monosaccharide ABC transporter ATP-binding protein (CUT2 family) n=1 Tax=Haloactinopolyspora alba TaxID=648780 RepID=A0A2P8E768_9ACTN|nr:sugar ABC transporter ATP-binding protein [Haloactinopolyspora alba]PSL05320.1 monosaccharide ABC transporter ATP-binding protein (CUT2 family) [Haloactinopolyspora alba]
MSGAASPSDPAAVAVDVSGLSKQFGPVRALDDVSLQAPAGTITAVMGENGAGKSTLMKVLAGLDSPTAGTVTVAGEQVRRFDAATMLSRHRVALVPQELALAQARSVAENIMLGAEPGPRAFPNRAEIVQRAAALLGRLGENLDPRRPVGELDAATQQLVVIARSLARDANVVIFDEPTSVLSPAESERLFTVIDGLRADGVTMLYVSHRMPEVFRLSDHVHVLRDGRHVGAWRTADAEPDDIVSAMVGRTLQHEPKAAGTTPATSSAAAPRLQVRELRGAGFDSVTVDIAPGEVIGVAGLPDSGRIELLRAVFGADHRTGGTMHLDGEPFAPHSPRDAIRARVAYLPGERRHQGIFPTMSVADNVNALTLDRHVRFGLLRRRSLRRDADEHARELRVKTSTTAQAITQLSGGNQQKALLARWLSIDPRLMVLDEPTRGVDVGAKAELYALFRSLTERGVAVLASSSDLPELLAISDRIAVMAAGRVVDIVPAAEATEEGVMAMATGARTMKETA